MSVKKPDFSDLLAHYPTAASDFGAGGRIINNPAYANTCALRLSTALDGASPGFLGQFHGNQAVHLEGRPGHYRRIIFPFARSALALANYLWSPAIGWSYRRLETRAEALGLKTQGIIFWKVRHDCGSPNHIDLWDPLLQGLRAEDGRAMLWAPRSEGIVDYAWFWDLPRGAAASPGPRPHWLQSA
jgi:hypothetical protein